MARRETIVYILCLVLSFALLFLDTRSTYLTPFKTFVQNLSFPLQQSLRSSDHIWQQLSFSKNVELNEKIQYLEEENAILLSKLVSQNTLISENTSMRRLLGSQVPPNWKFEPAQVIKQVEDELFLTSDYVAQIGVSIITLDKNFESEFGQYGIYLGKVSQRQKSLTTIRLPTHSSSKILVNIRNPETQEKKSSGILEGKGGKVLLTQILSTDPVASYDIVSVVETEQDLGLRGELLVGTIQKVIENTNSTFKQAEVKLFINPKYENIVYFVTKS